MAKRKLEPFEISPTQIANALGLSTAAISVLPHNGARYLMYKYAYLYRLISQTLSKQEAALLQKNEMEPKTKDLVEYFGMSRQNFSALKKNNSKLFFIYIDAWKYVFVLKKSLTALQPPAES
jgi:DNA-binding Xre family transcriptional regulator